MPDDKSTIKLNELKDFFTSDQKVCNLIFDIVFTMKFSVNNWIGKKVNYLHYNPKDIVILLLLFPLFQINNVKCYSQSVVKRLHMSGKDVFYRLKNNEFINWRLLSYSITLSLLTKIKKNRLRIQQVLDVL